MIITIAFLLNKYYISEFTHFGSYSKEHSFELHLSKQVHQKDLGKTTDVCNQIESMIKTKSTGNFIIEMFLKISCVTDIC